MGTKRDCDWRSFGHTKDHLFSLVDTFLSPKEWRDSPDSSPFVPQFFPFLVSSVKEGHTYDSVFR